VRIHVERVIGAVRQRFLILQSTLPIHNVMKRNGEDVSLIDHMLHVCCALNNVCDSVVPIDEWYFVLFLYVFALFSCYCMYCDT